MTTTTTISPQPEQGQMVSARSRNWIVTDVSTSTLPPERLQTSLESLQHFITLSSVEDDENRDGADALGLVVEASGNQVHVTFLQMTVTAMNWGKL